MMMSDVDHEVMSQICPRANLAASEIAVATRQKAAGAGDLRHFAVTGALTGADIPQSTCYKLDACAESSPTSGRGQPSRS